LRSAGGPDGCGRHPPYAGGEWCSAAESRGGGDEGRDLICNDDGIFVLIHSKCGPNLEAMKKTKRKPFQSKTKKTSEHAKHR